MAFEAFICKGALAPHLPSCHMLHAEGTLLVAVYILIMDTYLWIVKWLKTFPGAGLLNMPRQTATIAVGLIHSPDRYTTPTPTFSVREYRNYG